MNIRKGVQEDLPQVLGLIQELAEYEKAPNEVDNTVERMIEEGFGEKAVFEFFVAEENDKLVGIAIYYYSYSTWKGKCVYLEDLVVTESYRQQGIGKKLFDKVVEVAKNCGAGRLSWQVLDWNEPAINFYKKLHAELDGEWINCTLRKDALQSYPLD
jgi:GNAT superfamily N-acetyltransferase